jgi:hypothetical protein
MALECGLKNDIRAVFAGVEEYLLRRAGEVTRFCFPKLTRRSRFGMEVSADTSDVPASCVSAGIEQQHLRRF